MNRNQVPVPGRREQGPWVPEHGGNFDGLYLRDLVPSTARCMPVVDWKVVGKEHRGI
jgi:hypothetical protein